MNFIHKFKHLLSCFIDILFPKRCFICKNFSETEGLCQTCWRKITWISEPKCRICGLPFEFERDNICSKCVAKKPYFDKAISVFEYNDFSSQLIVMFKHHDITALNPYLSKLVYAASCNDLDGYELVIPVPITLKKRLKRKYNQSELIAQNFSKLSGIKYDPEILNKKKDTIDQERLSAKNRRRNLSGAFNVIAPEKIKNKNVILVDDVMTTGSTMNECSKVLKKYGAKKVLAITVARVSETKTHGRGERI